MGVSVGVGEGGCGVTVAVGGTGVLVASGTWVSRASAVEVAMDTGEGVSVAEVWGTGVVGGWGGIGRAIMTPSKTTNPLKQNSRASRVILVSAEVVEFVGPRSIMKPHLGTIYCTGQRGCRINPMGLS